MSRISSLLLGNVHFLVLFGIVVLAAAIRALNWNPDIILDYDPWWFFRHAQEIVQGGFVPPKWDILSFYPPGRPVDYYLGWSYTIAAFYNIVSAFMEISLTKFSGIFVAIFAGLSAIPAYFVGKHVTNKWGGLVTAFFATISITFLSVSLAGYPDSDAVDVFYTFLAVITTLYAIKKAEKVDFSHRHGFINSAIRYLPYLVPALVSYWLFAFNWSSSWYIYFIFVFFIPILVIFRIIEAVFRREKFGKSLIVSKIRENKHVIFAILAIGFLGEIISLLTSGWPFNIGAPHYQLITGLNIIGTRDVALAGFGAMLGLFGAITGVAFGRVRGLVIGLIAGVAIAILLMLSGITGQSLIVNQSVAELQPIQNVFAQFGDVVGRIGSVPMFFALAAFAITALKIFYRKSIHTAEYFAIIWLIISLFLITKGIRFSLLFSMAVATAAGFTVGNLIDFALKRRSFVLVGAFVAMVLVGGLIHFDENFGFSDAASRGLDVSQNWRDALSWLKTNADEDALVSTWWDPGHIIAGSTGLKVMADGAHCPSGSCIFLDHNSRIQDMGRAFATSSEDESVRILSKYTGITESQCSELQRTFPNSFTPEACEPVSEMYVLATSDLIGKYYWLSYFGTGTGTVYANCQLNQGETQRLGGPTYVCGSSANEFREISLTQQGNIIVSVYNSYDIDDQGRPIRQTVRNAPVLNTMLYNDQGQLAIFRADTQNMTNVIDSLVFVDPSYQTMVFMNPQVRDSVFTNMFFFNGQGSPQVGIEPLTKYELVYSNPEVRIFKLTQEDFNSARQ